MNTEHPATARAFGLTLCLKRVICPTPCEVGSMRGGIRPDGFDLAPGTMNRHLPVVRRILRLSAELWRDEASGLTWLAVAPMIRLESKYKKRAPYPLGWDEQLVLLPALAPHLQRMALFGINTGARQEEICGLKGVGSSACQNSTPRKS